MTRRLASLALTLAALTACARGPASPVYRPPANPGPPVHGVPGSGDMPAAGGAWSRSDAPSEHDGYDEYDAPLRVRLVDGAGGLGVQLNRPAHVALFEVVPGRGMGLVYPAHGSDRSFVSAGYSRVQHSRLRPYTWYYDGAGFSPMGPRYYLLVASRRPLWIERFQDDPGALRGWFGLRSFAARNPYPAMDELVDLVVPPQDDADWDTDLLTVWPHDGRLGFDEHRLVRVVCQDGSVVTTTWDSAHLACRRFRHQPARPSVPPQRPDTLDAQPSDSVRVPTRRRPEPRSADDGGDRVDGAPTDVRVAPPRRPAPVERWREPEGTGPQAPRPPRLRPADAGEGSGVIAVPERELVRPPVHRRPEGVQRTEPAPRTVPQREIPAAEEPRREPTPREAPSRPERARPEARVEPARSAERPASARPASREGGADPQ